eukprot:752990_1
MQLIRGLVLFMWMVIAFGDPPVSVPDCINPTLPFANQQAARNYALYYLNECVYEYWKSESEYRGMKGYKAMFGGDGYAVNQSTVIQIDNQTIKGYKWWRAKAV